MSIYFTADHHAGHANVIKYANRPFLDTEHMDDVMVIRWNERVKPDDIVYHLADLTLGGQVTAANFLRRLNGHIRILGYSWHHDKRWLDADFDYQSTQHPVIILPAMVVLEFPQYGIGTHPRRVTLCHYPMAEWEASHFGGWLLHAHSHGRQKYPPGTLALDVGVDVHNFYPISLEQVAEIMQRKENEK